MPVITHNSLNAAAAPIEDGSFLEDTLEQSTVPSPPLNNVDLLDQTRGLSDPVVSAPAPRTSTSNDLFDIMNTPASLPVIGTNLLDEISFGVSAVNPISAISTGDPFDLLSDSARDPPNVVKPERVLAINSAGIEAHILVLHGGWVGDSCQLQVEIFNNTPETVRDFAFQAAVTKAFSIELYTPSSSTLEPLGKSSITQAVKISRISHGQPLRMRTRATYTCQGSSHKVQGEVNKFPGLD